MAYHAGYQNDIFISYAHVDDVELSGPGWVTMFVRYLKAMLAKKLGRTNSCKIWSDHGLKRDELVTPQIMEEVRGSATLLIMLSPAYIGSAWCGKELREFFDNVRDRERSKSVFIVEVDRTEGSQRPAELADRAGFRFWFQDPDNDTSHILGWPHPNPDRDKEYFSELDDLVQQIVDAFNRLRADKTSDKRAPPEPHGAAYLAQVTDDLDAERNGVRRFLEQSGLRVVPAGWYPLDAAAFRRSARADIDAADVFVQLLSAVAGKRPRPARGVCEVPAPARPGRREANSAVAQLRVGSCDRRGPRATGASRIADCPRGGHRGFQGSRSSEDRGAEAAFPAAAHSIDGFGAGLRRHGPEVSRSAARRTGLPHPRPRRCRLLAAA